MHFVSLVPLSLGILFVVVVAMAKAAALLIIAVIGLVVWLIYELFFKKEEVQEEEPDPETEFWERMLEDRERDNEEFYKEIGRLEQKLDDLEESAGITKKRRKKN